MQVTFELNTGNAGIATSERKQAVPYFGGSFFTPSVQQADRPRAASIKQTGTRSVGSPTKKGKR